MLYLSFVLIQLFPHFDAFTFLHNEADPKNVQESSHVDIEVTDNTATINYISFKLKTLQENGVIALLKQANSESLVVQMYKGDLFLAKDIQYR